MVRHCRCGGGLFCPPRRGSKAVMPRIANPVSPVRLRTRASSSSGLWVGWQAKRCAGIAQLVERNLAKVEVASSSLVSRSSQKKEAQWLPFFNVCSIRRAWLVVFELVPGDACSQTAGSSEGCQRECRDTRPGGETGRHCGLKIRRFLARGHTGSIPVPGTTSKSQSTALCVGHRA